MATFTVVKQDLEEASNSSIVDIEAENVVDCVMKVDNVPKADWAEAFSFYKKQITPTQTDGTWALHTDDSTYLITEKI